MIPMAVAPLVKKKWLWSYNMRMYVMRCSTCGYIDIAEPFIVNIVTDQHRDRECLR